MELKSIDAVSCGKLLGLMYAIIGLIIGGLAAIASLLGAAGPQAQGGGNAVMILGAGVGSLVIFPFLYGILGFIGGIVSAFIYNFVAGLIGGIVLNFHLPPDEY